MIISFLFFFPFFFFLSHCSFENLLSFERNIKVKQKHFHRISLRRKRSNNSPSILFNQGDPSWITLYPKTSNKDMSMIDLELWKTPNFPPLDILESRTKM